MINSTQTQQIRMYLLQQGFTNTELIDDLVDHLSCEIEILIANKSIDFNSALLLAKGKVMPDYAIQIENDLNFLTNKKNNIMIKKLAFIGGYFSAVCLCLSILFFSQSLLGSKRSELKMQAIQVEYNMNNPGAGFKDSEARDELNAFYLNQQIESSQKFELAENFLLIALILFASLYLPYQFYSRYQRSEQELYHA